MSLLTCLLLLLVTHQLGLRLCLAPPSALLQTASWNRHGLYACLIGSNLPISVVIETKALCESSVLHHFNCAIDIILLTHLLTSSQRILLSVQKTSFSGNCVETLIHSVGSLFRFREFIGKFCSAVKMCNFLNDFFWKTFLDRTVAYVNDCLCSYCALAFHTCSYSTMLNWVLQRVSFDDDRNYNVYVCITANQPNDVVIVMLTYTC